MMAFVQREITLIFDLVDAAPGSSFGAFNSSGANRLTVSGARVKCRIEKHGGNSMSNATVQVYGLTKAHLQRLSALNKMHMVQERNVLTIQVGNVTTPPSPLTTVFQGVIALGQIDLSQMPESCLNIVSHAGLYDAVATANASAYEGKTNMIPVLQDISQKMSPPLTFENGLTSKDRTNLDSPVLSGTLRSQAYAIVDALGCNLVIDNGVFAIYPRFGVRKGTTPVPVISPQNGMIGYPSYSEMGISIKTLFVPLLNIGQLVNVQSSMDFANGNWGAYSIIHELESQIPDGQWFTTFNGRILPQ